MVVTTIARIVLDDGNDLVGTDDMESACTWPVEQQLSPKVVLANAARPQAHAQTTGL